RRENVSLDSPFHRTSTGLRSVAGVCSLQFSPQDPGHSSVGMRIDRMYYFKGAVRQARFTPRALAPSDFLNCPKRDSEQFLSGKKLLTIPSSASLFPNCCDLRQ